MIFVFFFRWHWPDEIVRHLPTSPFLLQSVRSMMTSYSTHKLYEAWWRHILLIDWDPSAWRLLRWATYCGSALMQFKPNLSTFIYEAVWKRLNFVQEWVFHAWWLIDTWWYTVNWVGSVFKVEGQSTYNRSFKFNVSNRKISITGNDTSNNVQSIPQMPQLF